MPQIDKGKLAGFYQPDYDGGSIVNLLSSIIHACGGKSPHCELNDLPATELKNAKNIVYLVIDGLGLSQLQQFIDEGHGTKFLAKHPYRQITTVFPATTAAAITSFSTGATPAEHGILSWHLHLHDLGVVSTILPCTMRTGMPLFPEDFDLDAYLQLPRYVDSVPIHKELLSFGHIPNSRFSLAGTNWKTRRAFSTLSGLQRHTLSFARQRRRGMAYVYWPKYDSYCHEYGCQHMTTLDHLCNIDDMLAKLTNNLRNTNTILLVTADHGLVDSPAKCCIDLANIPGLYDCLTTLPSGDARAISCFVRPKYVQKFLQIVDQHLSKACVCCEGNELLDFGLYGKGQLHASIENRVGDYVLLARDQYALGSSLPGAPKEFHIGNHGGLSETEVRVPLFVIKP